MDLRHVERVSCKHGDGNAGKGERTCLGGGRCTVKQGGWGDFTEILTFGWNLREGEELALVISVISGKSAAGGRNSMCKGPEAECAWHAREQQGEGS